MRSNRKYEVKDPLEMAKNRKKKIRGYAILACFLLGLHFLLTIGIFSIIGGYKAILEKLTLSLSIVVIILLLGKLVENAIHKRNGNEGDKHNLLSISRLITSILVIIVTVAFLFQNLYAIAVSFGLISLVLGFALQAPISSFIAWLYIVFKKPYKIGDRIQLEGMKGDVVDVNYLDTAMLECSGDYLQNDRRSGRIIYFPNSIILKAEVINYSGPLIPFIWNETGVQIAYTSDLPFVEESLIKAAKEDFNERFPEYEKARITKWDPAVYFRVNRYAWLEAVVSYPVEPSDTTGRRNRILKRALPVLNAEPEKVQFPQGSIR